MLCQIDLGKSGADLKVNVCVYSSDIPVGSEDYTLITLRYWTSLSQSHLLGENAAQFSEVVPIHTSPILVPLDPLISGPTP